MSKAILIVLAILISVGPAFVNILIAAEPIEESGITADQMLTMISEPEPAQPWENTPKPTSTNIVTTNRPIATGAPEFDIFYNGSIRGDLGEMTSGVQARTVTLLNTERREHPQLISLCAGDSLGPSATSNVDGGKAIIDIMNLCKYDVSGIGPHEFSYGWDNFTRRAKQANFPFVCSNLSITGGSEMVKPYVLIERNGSKLLVLGATSPKVPPRWPSWPSNVKVNDGIEALVEYAPLAEKADFVILLSSMMFEENIAVLKKLPWIHSIISTIVVGTKLIDLSFRDISLVDGRKLLWTFHSGKTTGFMNARKINKGVFMSIQLHEVADGLEPNPEAVKIIETIEKQTIAEQSEHLCKLSESEAANLPETMLNALRYELNGEVALVDLSSFKTKNNMNTMTPHGLRKIYPYLSRGALSIITGAKLRHLWSIRHDPIIWNQGLAMIGLSEKRGKLLINGRLLHNDRKYRVATTEFLALGSLGLLPKQPNAVQESSLIELLIRHFRKNNDASDRAIMYRRLERRRINRRKIKLDLAYDRLSFGGSADQYQYIDPSTFGIGSDIPSLVGNPHDSLRLELNDELIMEDPRADTTLRLDVAYTTWNEGRSVDRAEFTIRKEAVAIDGRPRLFGEYKLTGTLRPPELADQSHPLFGKAVAGMVWKLSEHSKILAGIGHLSRFSQPGKPMSLGLNMQYELYKPIHTNIDFKIAFDGFASWEEEEVRTGDLDLELRFKITKHLSTVARYRRFLWNDDMADDSALRSEVFIGFGITKAIRRF